MQATKEKATWDALEARIKEKVTRWCEKEPHPRIATRVKCRVSERLVPEDFPATSGSRRGHVAYLIGRALDEEDVYYIGHVDVSIVRMTDEFDFRLTWNMLVPVDTVKGILDGYEGPLDDLRVEFNRRS